MANLPTFKTLYRLLAGASLAGFALILILVLRKSPAPNLPYDRAAAARVENKIALADQASASGQHAQVQLDRTELNSYVAQNLQMAEAPQSAAAVDSDPAKPAQRSVDPSTVLTDGATLEEVQSAVKDVKVDMDGDLVKAYVLFDFHGQELSLELDGHIGAQDGYLKFDPVAGKLGSMPLPQALLESTVQKLMASPENREKLRLPPDISDIHIADGQAVVSYKDDPTSK